MNNFFLDSRIVMFAICTSIEYDLRVFLSKYTKYEFFTEVMLSKAIKRNNSDSIDNTVEILMQLDLSDYISLIVKNPHQYCINNEKAKLLNEYFSKIIPIRNRVAHTKPFEIGDRSILFEIIDTIDSNIPYVSWDRSQELKNVILNNPNEIYKFEIPVFPNNRNEIMHNLPYPEFDDTGYIGRKKEILELKELLLNKKNQIITIVGNGGFGKTALAVKTLYDLVDDTKNFYDAIVWISLKTRTLANGEFVEINNAISSMMEVYDKFTKDIINESNSSSKDVLLSFMDAFKTILVLDNLETIGNEEIMSFLKSIPENSKVLITSRHGIGELEYRYILNGLLINDAVLYFRELSKYYGLTVHKKNDEDIKTIIQTNLYSSPLSIKWYMTGLYNGLNESQILNRKDDLIEFCMSNVYNKLSYTSKNILQLFLIENSHLSFGEIDYYMEMDDVEYRIAINELNSTNMITFENGKYSLKQIAKDYLSKNHAPDNSLVKEVFEKRKRLNNALQMIKVKNENDPFNPKSIFTDSGDVDKKIAAYYLTLALEKSKERMWDYSFNLIEKASNIAPDYFEVYKIKAFIYATKNEYYNALENYNIAIAKCLNNFERASVLYLKSVFYTIKLQDYDNSLLTINIADKEYPNQITILMEKSRVLMMLGKYDFAEELLIYLYQQSTDLSSKSRNIFGARFGELYRRKAENFQIRDNKLKKELLLKAVDFIIRIEDIDDKSYFVLLHIIKDLSYMIANTDVAEVILNVFNQHHYRLKSVKSNNWNKINENILKATEFTEENALTSLIKYTTDYKSLGKQINDINIGMVYYTKNNFGFLINAHYPEGVYFSQSINSIFGEGDLVEFELSQKTSRLQVSKMKIIKR